MFLYRIANKNLLNYQNMMNGYTNEICFKKTLNGRIYIQKINYF